MRFRLKSRFQLKTRCHSKLNLRRTAHYLKLNARSTLPNCSVTASREPPEENRVYPPAQCLPSVRLRDPRKRALHWSKTSRYPIYDFRERSAIFQPMETAAVIDVPSGARKLARKLGFAPAEEATFLQALCSEGSDRPAIVSALGESTATGSTRASFQPEWVRGIDSAVPCAEREYQLDLSSVFLLSPLYFTQSRVTSPFVLDLCASPGGKTILAARALAPGLSASNEVIQKRIPALISNLKRCGIKNSQVFSRDPAFFGSAAKSAFDVCIADVPCSGQSLFGNGGVLSGVFHETLVRKNGLRQRRIIAAAANTVTPGGLLLYSTCTFSREENEAVIEWFLRSQPEFSAVEVPNLEVFKSRLTDCFAYRLFPHQGFGRGGFTALFRRAGNEPRAETNLTAIWRQE